jgi:hypothetical protein
MSSCLFDFPTLFLLSPFILGMNIEKGQFKEIF